MADWFAQNAPQGDNWFAKNAPASMPDPGVPNPLQANPGKYTPAGLRLGDKPLPSTTVGAEALRNLPGALVRYASLGMTQPDTIGPQGIVNPVTGIMDAASDIYHTFRHPLESFAQDPVATVNTPAMIRAGGKGAREAVNATGVGPVVSTAAKGAREGITAELPQIKNWSKWGAIAGLPLGMGTGDIATRVLGASEGGGIGGAVAGGARAIPAAVRGARGALARRAATKWTPTTEGYMPTIGQGASPRPPTEPPPPPSGPPRGPDWWEAYQQELRSQPPPQEPYYPPPPEPTYIEPPPPPAAVAAPVGPRLPEGWEPTIPDYMKPGAETAEQMAARHEAEAAAARPAAPTVNPNIAPHGYPQAAWERTSSEFKSEFWRKLNSGEAQPEVPSGLTAPKTPPPTAPSLDRLTAQVTGGANKTFAQASEAVKKEVLATAPPVVAPPPGVPSDPAPTGQPSIRQEPNRPVFNKQQELGEDYMRQTRLDKEEFVVNYLKSKGITKDAFESAPLAKKNQWIKEINTYRRQINSPLEVAQEPSHVMRQDAKGRPINLSQYTPWGSDPVDMDSLKRLMESPMWNAPSQWKRGVPPPPPPQ